MLGLLPLPPLAHVPHNHSFTPGTVTAVAVYRCFIVSLIGLLGRDRFFG